MELLGAGPSAPYFFVQVKTTRAGYTRKDRRLKVQVDAGDLEALAAHPAPTYIVGIDDRTEQGYLVSPRGVTPGDLSSLSTRFPLDTANKAALWAEVRDYWRQVPPPGIASRFSDPDGR